MCIGISIIISRCSKAARQVYYSQIQQYIYLFIYFSFILFFSFFLFFFFLFFFPSSPRLSTRYSYIVVIYVYALTILPISTTHPPPPSNIYKYTHVTYSIYHHRSTYLPYLTLPTTSHAQASAFSNVHIKVPRATTTTTAIFFLFGTLPTYILYSTAARRRIKNATQRKRADRCPDERVGIYLSRQVR